MIATHWPAPLVMNFGGPHRWHFGQTIRSGGKLALNVRRFEKGETCWPLPCKFANSPFALANQVL